MEAERWWDVPAVLLLIAALLTAGGRLVATGWVEHLTLVQTLVLLGTAAGLALGQSEFSPGLAALYAILYGVFAVPWQLGVTAGYLSDEAAWADRLVVMAGRLGQAFVQLARQDPVRDPILFLSAMAVLAWALSVHAGYTLTRRASPWLVVLPTGLALLLIQTSDVYRPRGVFYVAAYAFFSLLMVTRLTFIRLRKDWMEEDARIPPLVGLDLSTVVVLLVAGLLFFAWTLPSAADALPTARRIWDQATSPIEERADKLFASLRRRGPTVTATYYGEEFALGQGRQLSDNLIMSVQAPETSPGVRYYWRARVYDRYVEGGWSTAALTITRRVREGELPFDFPDLKGRQVLTFTFTSPRPVSTLYTAPQPQWVSRAVEVDFAENPDGTVDVASLHAVPPIGAGQTYAMRSSVADVTVAELREAGTDYPQWVTDRYLQLSDGVTPRTRELAERIVEGRETPYDKAAAITRYLRNAIEYTETLERTPAEDQDPLDWFLFEEQAGFCNYYASAEVVLLRSLGIPARLAIGFGQGDRQQRTNTFLVYERNAHAWPEVYFPRFGWVEFEPTVSEEPITRPLGDIGEDEDGAPAPMEGESEERWPQRLDELEELDERIAGEEASEVPQTPWYRRRGLLWALAIALGATLVALTWRAWRRTNPAPVPVLLDRGVRRLGWRSPGLLQRWADYALLTPLERAYSEIDRARARLGIPSRPAETPAERVAALADRLPPASESALSLLGEYQAAAYGRHRYTSYVAQEASRSIRRLSWRAKLLELVGWKLSEG